jgi:hypothetical protein
MCYFHKAVLMWGVLSGTEFVNKCYDFGAVIVMEY